MSENLGVEMCPNCKVKMLKTSGNRFLNVLALSGLQFKCPKCGFTLAK